MFEVGEMYYLDDGTCMEFVEETDSEYIFLSNSSPWVGIKEELEDMYDQGKIQSGRFD